jgi:hypothetical protein
LFLAVPEILIDPLEALTEQWSLIPPSGIVGEGGHRDVKDMRLRLGLNRIALRTFRNKDVWH